MSEQSPSHHGGELGLAGKTARAFIQSPLSPLLFLGMLAMGILGLMATPRQEDPQISVPLIDIFFSYPGASAEQVSAMAVEPLERIMSEIPGVKHVYSAAMRGQGIVTVRFEVGEQAGPSLVKIHDKMASNLDKMPAGVLMPPLIKAKGIDDVPVVTLTLWSSELDGASLRRLGNNVLQELKQIPNTGEGFVVGGQREEIRVEIVPNKLAGLGITAEQVANVIRGANAENAVGASESDNRSLRVYAGAFLQSPRDVENLVVAVRDGRPVYVRDVATVSRAAEEAKSYVNYYTGPSYQQPATGENVNADGELAVTVAIAKKIGSNGVTVANAVLDRIESLQERLIPEQVRVEVTRNYGETAQDKVNELLFKLVVATGIVTLLVWWALGFKPAVVVTVVIPVVILMTVFSAFVMGFTIDRVSLFALIFSIGILVDDAIVVVENIHRHLTMKSNVGRGLLEIMPRAVDEMFAGGRLDALDQPGLLKAQQVVAHPGRMAPDLAAEAGQAGWRGHEQLQQGPSPGVGEQLDLIEGLQGVNRVSHPKENLRSSLPRRPGGGTPRISSPAAPLLPGAPVDFQR